MRRRKAGSVVDEGARRHHHQLDAAARRHRREGGGQRIEHRLQGERPLLRPEGAGIELGDVEQRIEQRFDGAQAGIDLAAEIVAGIAVDHRRGEQARGVQRLQQVVAGGGDEARLAEIGGLGLGAAGLELGGALDHPLLQRLGRLAELAVALAQRLGGAHARGHVVAGGDEAAAGQRVEPELDDRPPRVAISCVCGASGRRSSARRRARRRTPSARRRPPRGVVERQQGGEAVVGDLQPAVAVEGGDAHADMVERVAQDVVVVADRLGRLVDQRARAARQQPAAPAERGDDDARRGGAQGARQHALGAVERHLDREPLAGQGPLGALGADEARQQLAQFVDARGIGRRLALRLFRARELGAQHEGVGLLGVGAARADQQRDADQQQGIDQDADDEALADRIEVGQRRRQVGVQRRQPGRRRRSGAGSAAGARRARRRSRRPGPPPRRSGGRAASRGRARGRARSWRRRRS